METSIEHVQKNFLITGKTGFILSNLVNLNTIINWTTISFRENTDNINLKNQDGIIHAAGIAHDLSGDYQKQDYLNINYSKTKSLYDLFLKSDSKYFFYLSSVKVYDERLGESIITENSLLSPNSWYGKSKLLSENYILNNLPKNHKKVYIFRLAMVHGPGNKGNLNILIKFIHKNLPWFFKDCKRTYCSINVLNYFINQFIVSNPNSGAYNICDDYPISTHAILRKIAVFEEKKIRIYSFFSNITLFIIALLNPFKLPFLNSSVTDKITKNLYISNKKAKKAIGLKKDLPFDSLEDLEQTIISLTNAK